MRAREIKHAAKLLGLPAGLQKNGRIGPGAPACDSPPVLFDAGGAFYGAVRTLPTVLVLLLRGKFAVAFGEWVYVCAYAHSSLAVVQSHLAGSPCFGRFARSLIPSILDDMVTPHARQLFCASLLRAAYRWGGIAAARHPRSRVSRAWHSRPSSGSGQDPI